MCLGDGRGRAGKLRQPAQHGHHPQPQRDRQRGAHACQRDEHGDHQGGHRRSYRSVGGHSVATGQEAVTDVTTGQEAVTDVTTGQEAVTDAATGQEVVTDAAIGQ